MEISVDKIPNAIEIEDVILGALLLDETAIDSIVTILTPDMFYSIHNREIYRKIVDLAEKGRSFDLFTLAQELSEELKDVGAASYLTSLSMKISSAHKIREHAMIVREKYILRQMLLQLPKIIRKIEQGDDTDDIVQAVNKHAESINKLTSGSSGGMTHISFAIEEAIQQAQQRQIDQEKGKAVAISTGIRDLDQKITGWRPSEMVILGARPAQGKTQLMLHFAERAAMQGKSVCIYSLEMSDVSLANRLILAKTGIDRNNFKRGYLDESDWIKINDAQKALSKLPIYVDSNSSVSMSYIASHARQMRKKGKCDIIFLDYIQLADLSTTRRSATREEDVSELGRGIKILAKELDIPIIALSQLSRKVEERSDKMPILSDIRESGQLEAHADMVMFLMRPQYYSIDHIEIKSKGEISTKNMGMISIAKQRDGETGLALFSHNDNFTKIMNYGEVDAPPKSSDPTEFRGADKGWF